eukprot:365630-Chlamydomonas_euryale.AAC.23
MWSPQWKTPSELPGCRLQGAVVAASRIKDRLLDQDKPDDVTLIIVAVHRQPAERLGRHDRLDSRVIQALACRQHEDLTRQGGSSRSA